MSSTRSPPDKSDAGLVYVTDARSAGDKVATINFPEAVGAVNIYPIAVLKKAHQAALAQKVRGTLVISEGGRKSAGPGGFQKPQAEP